MTDDCDSTLQRGVGLQNEYYSVFIGLTGLMSHTFHTQLYQPYRYTSSQVNKKLRSSVMLFYIVICSHGAFRNDKNLKRKLHSQRRDALYVCDVVFISAVLIDITTCLQN